MAGASTAPEPFEAFLYPNPALSDRGYALFMTLAAAATAAIGGLFVAVGAWPVGGFFGLDLFLLWIAFRAARRNARRYEWVRVDRGDVRVRRVGPDGRAAEWRFEPFWVRVHFDEPPTPHSLVVLASHGRRIALGGFLTPEERREFASALRAAIERVRHPTF
jgi:uncharacterized membrane protein